MSELRLPHLDIRVAELRSSAFITDYNSASPALAPFFTGAPRDISAYRRKLQDVDTRFDSGVRARVGDAVRVTSTRAREQLEAVRSGNGVFITTGQQPGLFGGPLYTVHKLLSAIVLAEQLERALGRTVLPLFWIASNDHDWAEARHASVLAADNSLRRIELPDDGRPPVSMQHRVLGDDIAAALDALAQALPVTDFTTELLETLRAAYTPDATMAQAFESQLLDLFSEFDIAVTSATSEYVTRAAAPVLLRELEHADRHAELLAKQTERLVASGYNAQVVVSADAANVMYEDEQGRERLVRENGAWHTRRTKRSFSFDEIRTLLEDDPVRFSPNVLLRPVVESAVFPTIAYVGGPAETNYFAQTGCLFAAHGVGMPVVFPRHSVTIVEPKVQKVLTKFGLDVADVQQPIQELANRIARDELPDEVSDAIAALQSQIDAAYERLGSAGVAIDPTLKTPIDKAKNAQLSELRNVEKKILQHLKQRNEVSIEQITKAATNLFPDGSPQERVLSVVGYQARYGKEILHAIRERIAIALDQDAPEWRGVECP